VTGLTSDASLRIEDVAMDMRTTLFLALLAGGFWNGWEHWSLRPMHPPDGQIAPEEPSQTDIDSPKAFSRGRWTLTPRAHYELTARILSREDYRFDVLAELAPEDLALGWGPMSDNRVIAHFDISQGARFYSWRPRAALPIPREDVVAHSANTHVIPADAYVRKQLGRLRVGEVVRLTGTLVDGVRDDGAWFHTSLTRTDSGAGACEIMLVERVEH
jgi:hypothetical protein